MRASIVDHSTPRCRLRTAVQLTPKQTPAPSLNRQTNNQSDTRARRNLMLQRLMCKLARWWRYPTHDSLIPYETYALQLDSTTGHWWCQAPCTPPLSVAVRGRASHSHVSSTFQKQVATQLQAPSLGHSAQPPQRAKTTQTHAWDNCCRSIIMVCPQDSLRLMLSCTQSLTDRGAQYPCPPSRESHQHCSVKHTQQAKSGTAQPTKNTSHTCM